MNKYIRAWIKALRSGKYKQGRYRLHPRDTFCCLGVACDISKLGEWREEIPRRNEVGPRFTFAIPDSINESHSLPPVVQKQLGIDHALVGNLIAMNDKGATFNEIADYIEEQCK